jgi:hypothetical protein
MSLQHHGAGAVVVDNDVTVMDEERTCCCELAGLQGGVGVVEKFVRVGGSGKGGNLEDKRDALGRDGGGTALGGAIAAIASSSGASIIVDQAVSKGLDGGPSTQ